MDLIFKYMPLIMRLSDHRAEIEEITTLLGPTIAELKKVWPKVLPLVTKLTAGLTAPK